MNICEQSQTCAAERVNSTLYRKMIYSVIIHLYMNDTLMNLAFTKSILSRNL